jgi:hypothetical protein
MHQHINLGDTVYFWFAANDTSGSGGDGASAAVDVRKAGDSASAAPIFSPAPALLSHANYPAGCYEVPISGTAINGFASDTTYAVFCTLAIDSQNPTGLIGSFTIDKDLTTKMAGSVNREMGLVISGHGLDHLMSASVTGTDITDDSVMARLVSKEATADWDDYDNTTDSLQSLRDSLATPVDVNTQVLDVLNTDTFAEPGQETPPATTTLIKKIGYIYKFLRNRLTVTSTTISVFNDDASTVDHKSTHSDDSTTYDRGEFTTGP